MTAHIACVAALGAVAAAIGVVLDILTHPKPKPPTQPSTCAELIERHQSTGVPAHITIKCRGHIE